MGLFALFCKCRACRPSQQDSSDAALLQSLRGQLEKLIVNGKTRFNILRAALWRKQAEDKFNDFVNEERLRRGEAAAKSSRERAGFFGKLVMRAKMNVGKVSLFDLVSMLMGVKRSKDSKIAATGEVASYADVFEELALPKTPRNRKVDARSKKRVEHSGHKLRDAAATVFVELTTEILTLKGRCRVHTTGCAFDAALHGWRFLHPELPSTVKFEFELTEDGPLELRLRDFQSPWTVRPSSPALP
ncbi:hypothetical protein M885DRAFT_64373 [Pelagophyceae sp. CCMP2097]|nr:hypothetical protein M885DRAFT_64373 [Pelagophyceae sp. CCMP2097]